MNLSFAKRIFCGVSGATILVLTGLTALRGDFEPEMTMGVGIALLLLAAAVTGIDFAHHDDAVSSASPGSSAASTRVTVPARIFCGTLALALFAGIVFGATWGPVDGPFLIVCLMAAVIGAWFARVAVKGEYYGFSRPEIPTSPRFHTLADPSRPLPDDASVSGTRELADPSRALTSEDFGSVAAPSAPEAAPSAENRRPR